jgi:hypothetical protein
MQEKTKSIPRVVTRPIQLVYIYVIHVDNDRQNHKLTLSDGRFMSTHATANPLVGGFCGTVGSTIANPLATIANPLAGVKRRSLSRVGCNLFIYRSHQPDYPK